MLKWLRPLKIKGLRGIRACSTVCNSYHGGRAHRSHRWGHWFESSTDHTEKPTPSGWVFPWAAPASHQCPIDALSASIGRGAEALPVADEARRKRSEQQVMQAAAKQGDDCELDRASEAQRDLVRVQYRPHKNQNHLNGGSDFLLRSVPDIESVSPRCETSTGGAREAVPRWGICCKAKATRTSQPKQAVRSAPSEQCDD